MGAGMSGIASARALQAAGLPVRLIDKGAGISGQKGIKARSHCWQGHNVRSRCAIPRSTPARRECNGVGTRSFGYVILIRWNQPYCWLA
ncbi:NAD(P)-binding protein [bacterium]|nr:NAD(P)-binding protein [bacterium]